MRFILEIDLDEVAGSPAKEVGRILRYWGSNLSDVLLVAGAVQDAYDTAYVAVGSWRVEG